MKPPLRAIFFDAGGTLIYADATVILTALAEHGVPRDLVAYRKADVAGRRAVVAWLAAGNQGDENTRWRLYARTLLDTLGCPPQAEVAVRAAVGARHREGTFWCSVADGTGAVLARLRAAGYTLGVVSNADGRVATFLEHAGLQDAFDFIIDSALVGLEKPDPRIFGVACERAGVRPGEAAHVGDVYQIDVLGARAAGVMPILFDPDDLLPAADCARIHSLAELPGLVAGAVAA